MWNTYIYICRNKMYNCEEKYDIVLDKVIIISFKNEIVYLLKRIECRRIANDVPIDGKDIAKKDENNSFVDDTK